MKCETVQREAIGFETGGLPPHLADHLASCDRCRKAFDRQKALCELLCLKRYEQPDAGFEDRAIRAVRDRLAAQDPAARPLSLWEWFAQPQPVYRLALAAVFAVLLAANLIILPFSPGFRAWLWNQERNDLPLAPDLATSQPPAPDALLANQPPQTNAPNHSVQYGTRPSALAEYPLEEDPPPKPKDHNTPRQ